jgi:hypothetical protein
MYCEVRVGGAMSDNDNGRLKLPWPMVAWGIAMLVGMLAAWGDMRVKMEAHAGKLDSIRSELAIRVAQQDIEHVRMWKAIDEAAAAERPKSRR